MKAIRRASVYTPEGILPAGTVRIEQGQIVSVGPDAASGAGDDVLEAPGLLLVPGLIDLQCNGLCGNDVQSGDPAILRALAAVLPRYGCTAFLPTLVTAPHDALIDGLAAIASLTRQPSPGAISLGTHMEGPWLSPSYYGAHRRADVRPFSAEELAECVAAAAGTLKLVTLAPEAPGNAEAVALVAATGALVSIGHSGASYEQAEAAVRQGARMATHCFNAMVPLHHRAPGLPGAAMDLPGLIPGVIPDGYHLHPATVRLITRARGPQSLVVVTDSVASAGLPPGTHRFQDREVHWDGETVRLPGGGLAGSGLTPIEALRRFIAMTGLPLAEALPSMTAIPARLIGEGRRRGAIEPGARADLVLLTQDLQVHTTLIGGEVAYQGA